MVREKYRYHGIPAISNNLNNKANTHTNMGQTRGLNNEHVMGELKSGV
jgi:hypothetical protein